MALPVGVETRTIRLTLPLDTLGNEPKVYAGTVQPDRPLVWAATGDRLWPTGARLPDAVAGFVDFDVPIVDQEGWVDKDGDPITGWTYKLVVTATWEVKSRTIVKYFQVLEATADVIDIELLPEGPVLPPLNPGDGYVSSVLGFTGPITGAQIIESLKDRFDRKTKWHPEDFGDGAPGYPNNDSPAIVAAIAAAGAFGGTVELMGGKTYGGSGDILQKNGVAVRGGSSNAYGNGNASRIKAIDDTFRYRWGSATAGGANFPGEFEGVIIDGDDIAGAGHELFRVEAVDSTLMNPVVLNSAGDGMVLHNAQNCTIINPRIDNCPDGDCYKVQNNDEAMLAGAPFNGQAGGHNIVFGGHITRGKRLFHFDYDIVDPGGLLNFWPHDNMFFGTIFEQYQDDCELLGRISDGEARFIHCTFTGSSGMLTVDEDCLILVENEKRPELPVYATFDSCDFGAGAIGVADLIRSKSYGAANAIRIYGKTLVANANQGYFLCDDRGPGGGLGVVGGVFGAIDGLTTATDGTGLKLSRGLNGGSGASFTTTVRQPLRWDMDADQGSPIQIRRKGDTSNRFQVDRDGGLRWLSGASPATVASIINVGAGLLVSGENVLQIASFTTAGRPAAANPFYLHRLILDTTIGALFWSDGATWRAVAEPVTTGSQPADSDLTQIAALTTTSFGRSLLTLADGTALAAQVGVATLTAAGVVELATTAETTTGTDATRATTPAGVKAVADLLQPLDTDLTAIAALATTTYGRALLTLANQAALVALLPNYQPLDNDLTQIAALTTASYGRSLLALTSANQLTAEILAASEVLAGRIEIATQIETNTGTDDVRAVTPLKFATRLAAYAQPLDSDLTSIAALATTTYGRAILTLADQAALVALLPAYQASDADLTAIAAISTTSYGRALLALADQSALMGALAAASATAQGIVELATPAEALTGTDTTRAVTPEGLKAVGDTKQPLDADLTAIAALATSTFGRSLLALVDAAALAAALPAKGHSERKADGTQSIVTGAAAAAVLWGTSVVAERGGVSYAAGVFTIGTTGTYSITVQLLFAANVTGRRQPAIRKNGVVVTSGNAAATSAGVAAVPLPLVLDLVAGDTIDVTGFQDSGANLAITNLSYITIHQQ